MKDRECATCRYVFSCKGKPENVRQCLNYERRQNNGSDKNHYIKSDRGKQRGV